MPFPRHVPLTALPILFVAACASDGPAGPSSEADVGRAVAFNASPGASPVIVAELPLSELGGSGITGKVVLTRSAAGLGADIEADGLTSGYAYSVWWAVFDNPRGCDGPCDPSDLRNVRSAQGSLVNGSGFVGTGSTVHHQTWLARHDPEGKSVEAGDPSGVDNTYTSEIHIVLRNHGPAETDPANLALQVGTFGLFCNPPGCVNAAISMFAPPGSPGTAN